MRLGPFLAVLWIMYILIGMLDHTIMINGNTLAYGSYQTNCIDNITGIPNLNCDTNSVSSAAYYWSWVTQPENWTTSGILALLGGIFAITIGVSAAGAFLTRSDIYTLAPVAALWLLLGGITLVPLYSFITRNVGMFVTDCAPGQACGPAILIAALTVGIISLFYVMTVIEWWFWRPATQ